MMLKRMQNLDVEKAKKYILPFIKDPAAVMLWSTAFLQIDLPPPIRMTQSILILIRLGYTVLINKLTLLVERLPLIIIKKQSHSG